MLEDYDLINSLIKARQEVQDDIGQDLNSVFDDIEN